MNSTEQKSFARRFSFEDWGLLCRNSRFTAALETESAEVAEVIAHEILNPPPSPETAEQKERRQQMAEEREAALASKQLTDRAALIANRELPGKQNKQARKVRIAELLADPAFVANTK